jgi:hypothetical protein
MRKFRLHTTLLAVLWGFLFAYAIVQVQYNSDFLLGDVMRLTIPDNFVGVYYSLENDTFFVWSTGLAQWLELLFEISYNPERVSLSTADIISSQTILDVVDEPWIASVRVKMLSWNDIFSFPFVSDDEYHIVLSYAWLSDGTSFAIERVGFVQ